MFEAVNWNKKEDGYTPTIWAQNMTQMWSDEEHVPSDDKVVWDALNRETQDAYCYALTGLTGLDTQQANYGLPSLIKSEKLLTRKSTLGFMQMMEHVHAKSYSTIFTTLINDASHIDWLLEEWGPSHPILNEKARIIRKYYDNDSTLEDHYLQRVASVFLESYQFYSGFFLPVYLAGQGMLKSSGEIIDFIIRDEAVHGAYIGAHARELLNQLTPDRQEVMRKKTLDLLSELHVLETEYTKEIYGPIGLQDEVMAYVRYNANRALLNLGQEEIHAPERVNSIVLNGTSATAEFKQHDFFSQKGFYNKSVNIVKISEDSFKNITERLARMQVQR